MNHEERETHAMNENKPNAFEEANHTRQTSLLGAVHVELAAPTNVAPEGRLKDGSLIPLSDGASYPSTEQTLTAVSLLLNGGGLGGLQDVTAALSKALTSITGMITCNYAIPAGSDPRLVNVQTALGQGMTTSLFKVDSAAACGATGGWYYDNNATPTAIVLCPQTCDPLKATANSGVQVVYGCPSNPAK